jgi:D-beta-D-heptose 7-phosphate kinase/D-beta-D-heptose 1-phosphate adenosyltransferase
MLDSYITGVATRISPEAPVPVVNVRKRTHVPGGAANVAANAAALGARVAIAGVIGVDDCGRKLRTVLAGLGLDTAALVEIPSRLTTSKTRVTVGGHQIVRYDDEDTSPLATVDLQSLQAACQAALDTADACILSDYAKGVASPEFCRWLIAEAAAKRLPVVVDPKSTDFTRYAGATVITPNMKEFVAAVGNPFPADLDTAAAILLPTISPSALLVTRGESGMSLFETDRPERHLPAMVNEVADVTGAGDTVVAAIAVALGAGFDLFEAAAIANLAAGIAVSHHGTWAVRADELLALEAPSC